MGACDAVKVNAPSFTKEVGGIQTKRSVKFNKKHMYADSRSSRDTFGGFDV